MTSSVGFLALGRDPRLAPLAFAAAPAWLWRADAGAIVWSNAAGARLLGAPSPQELARKTPPAGLGQEISRLHRSLPPDGARRLVRLRGAHARDTGQPSTWHCTRFVLPDGGDGLLITGDETPAAALPLAERVRRPLADLDMAAAFAADGSLIHAGAAIGPRLGGTGTLAALGLEAARRQVLADGEATASTGLGTLSLRRFGHEADAVLIALLAEDTAGRPAAMAAPVTGIDLDEAERRFVVEGRPLRIVWHVDSGGRFTLAPGVFATLAGEPGAGLTGMPWEDVSDRLGLSPDSPALRAIAGNETFTEAPVRFPTTEGPLPALLFGFPVPASEGGGYRGFAVCRASERLGPLIAAARRRRSVGVPADLPAGVPASSVETAPAPPARTEDGQPVAVPEARNGLSLVPSGRNVVPLRAGLSAERRPALTAIERNAFDEIARALGARAAPGERTSPGVAADGGEEPPKWRLPAGGGSAPAAAAAEAVEVIPVASPDAEERAEELPVALPVPVPAVLGEIAPAVLDRLPLAVVAFRGNDLLWANRALLEWTGAGSLSALAQAGGLEALFAEPAGGAGPAGTPRPLALRTADGGTIDVKAHHHTLPLGPTPAAMLVLSRHAVDDEIAGPPPPAAEVSELRATLDIAADGVVVVDAEGRIASASRGVAVLAGIRADGLTGSVFLDLVAAKDRGQVAALMVAAERASSPPGGCEITLQDRAGEPVTVFITIGRIAETPLRLGAVLRDISSWKRAEQELTAARKAAEQSSSAKSDFLAKISHEIRTPLNAVIGFSEVMMEERLGPIGNERYRGYARDIHASGSHMISLLNDLLDLSKIEAGKLELTLGRVDLNDIILQCVAIMQPQASRDRIIIRTALAPILPPVVADVRSIRQILLNLLSNSIKFTGAGGQVILSTAPTDDGGVAMRVRDTGIGMSENDLATALEPFRQVATAARPEATGTGLGLPLTKALAQANSAEFRIRSTLNIGTLVEIVFPAARVLTE